MPSSLAPILLALGLVSAENPDLEPAITVRLTRPDVQLERLIDLFQGSRATDPASALAAWKRATKNAEGLGKAAEAGIAALNPRMIAELKNFDGAGFLLDFVRDRPEPIWVLALPRDDGTLSALATAMALTDGASEAPLLGVPVDRLGPPGAALMSRSQDEVVIGGSREALTRGSTWLGEQRATAQRLGKYSSKANLDVKAQLDGISRLAFELNANAFLRSSSISMRRVGEGLLGLGFERVHGSVTMIERNESFTVTRESREPLQALKIDPQWLGDLPNTATVAFSVALDSRPEGWDRLFKSIDRVEKADPDRAKVAPIRVRLNLIARAARLDPEADLWPKLHGVSGFMMGEARNPGVVAIGLHAKDIASAAKLRDEFLPRATKALSIEATPQADPTLAWRQLGVVAGRPLVVMKDTGPTVWICWGDGGISAIQSVRREERSSWKAPAVNAGPGCARLAWIWPSRLGLSPAGSPMAEALGKSPLIMWRGKNKDTAASDSVMWGDLRPAIRRFLDVIPQEPAPAPGR
ncbi:MAG: hypothetical protein JWN86_3742 [Planctomycetota bacterium]|nr:hypothetical protein [Planctomycetota bacterium]